MVDIRRSIAIEFVSKYGRIYRRLLMFIYLVCVIFNSLFNLQPCIINFMTK
jgi:hypothetical protein